jgi:hypothetical protein
MRKITLLVTLLAGVAATQGHAQTPAQSGDAAMIASAMQAAPKSIAEGATVVAMGADHKMRTLRQGTNGWTCMPDNPDSPGPDPMCMDANALAWAQAWIGKQAPPADRIGFMYMLAGGTDASNTDPYATGPAAGNAWIETGPHVMIVGPAALRAMQGYPREAKPDTTKPYVMWPGTPYEHLMIPIR